MTWRNVLVAIALVAVAGCTESAIVLGPADAGLVDVVDTGVPDDAGRDATLDAGPIVGVKDVTAGGAHSCAVLGGALSCWGDGSEGALGIGASGDLLAPARVGDDRDWISIVAGQGMTCGLRSGSGLYCWGANDVGQLGLGDRSPRAVPTPVALPGVPLLVRTARRFGCSILDDGQLVCWGENFEGQLGRADASPGEDGLTPEPVASARTFLAVSTGQGHTCAIASDGTLWCWGRNTDVQLGLGAGARGQIRTPTQVGNATSWAHVAAGQGHTCASREDGTLWCWGEDFAGQVGIALGSSFDVPTQVGTDTGWGALSTYVFHTCGVKADGTLWCWGRNAEGQLGVGDIMDRLEPTRVDDRNDWARVSAGWFHTCAQRRDGTIWCTGGNGDGRLGVGDGDRRRSFELVVGAAVE
ncbi:MAG: hypothetical protein M3Y87_32330 [Myxococcota bacterium]|nr:hypothetical protein [Myxococcota bacterium]